jgi:DNA-binding LacI/PurR family transcriptional regulator
MEHKDYIPIYKKLTEYYSNRIYSQEIAPGAKIDSINRMMERHNVSRETAKLVIRKLIERGQVVSVQGKGTFVNVVTVVKKVWGVVIPFFSSNIEQLIVELSKEASKAGCRLQYYLHYNNHEEEIRLTGSLVQQGFEAVVVVPNYNEALTANYYKRLITGKTILLLADTTMAGSFFNYVIQSYDLGVKRALDYLALQNKGNLLLLGNEFWKGQNLVFELMESTLRINIADNYPERKLFVRSSVNEINGAFIEEDNVGGILTVQDTDAIRLIGRLKEWDVAIPGEVSVVSYGNTELTSYYSPGITSVDCNYPMMAREIAEHISCGSMPCKRQVVILPELIIRET